MKASVTTTGDLSPLRSAEGFSPRRGGGGMNFLLIPPPHQDSFVKLKLQSSQPTLVRVGPLLRGTIQKLWTTAILLPKLV